VKTLCSLLRLSKQKRVFPPGRGWMKEWTLPLGYKVYPRGASLPLWENSCWWKPASGSM
jgi:hypothetical protein